MSTATPIIADLGIVESESLFEIINGQLVEKPPMGASSGLIASRIQNRLGPFAEDQGLGQAVTEMLFTLRAAPLLRRRPDVAFVSASRWPIDHAIPPGPAWNVVPELAVEVVSPTDPIEDVMDRILDFLAAGSSRVWLVFPKTRQVYVYDSPTSIRVLGPDDELDGEPVLSGFRCPVSSIFPPAAAGPSPQG